MRVHNSPTLVRASQCAWACARPRYRERASAGTPLTPSCRRHTHCGFVRLYTPGSGSLWAPRHARVEMSHWWPTHQRQDHRRLAIPVLSPCVLWCVWPPVHKSISLLTTRSGSHHEAPASKGETASGRGHRITVRVETTAASQASVFPLPAQARSLFPARAERPPNNTLTHSSPRAFKTVCGRAMVCEREPRKHIAMRTGDKPSHQLRSRTTRRPPFHVRGKPSWQTSWQTP